MPAERRSARTQKPGSWGELLEYVLKVGKDAALTALEREQRQTEWAAATAWETPETYALAKKLDARALLQLHTLIRLRPMTDADMRARLEQGDAG